MPVYFAQMGEGGPVKIGYSKNVAGRVNVIDVHCPVRVTLIRQVAALPTAERWYHERFSAQHIRREWFHFHPDMLTVEPPLLRNSEPFDFVNRHTGQPMTLPKVAFAMRCPTIDVYRWLVGEGAIPAEKQRAFERIALRGVA